LISCNNDVLVKYDLIIRGGTLEIFAEGHSEGSLSEMSRELYGKVDVPWNTLGEYMQWLQEKGISPNIAAFVGAATICIHQLGVDNINPDDKQLKKVFVRVPGWEEQ